ncbi:MULTISPECIES: gamma-glutamyl-CDP-amidate hydrolase [unclassified Helicobacter]|uniref:gamma-glutamyl-CDP-amidate hydrolase n=1 Tax=unclassified Helicobacter TaxID=2593540 RepID=UPI000CF0DC2A|nr:MULTISPECIES: gamma-glutamyl-CDP-amidate hydrolase [unclassified Helicobacter]
MKKMIGISQRLIEHAEYKEIREALAIDWGVFFRNKTNFIPLALSIEIDFLEYVPYLSGVILSGGNDLFCLNPDQLSKMRDDYERQIIEICLQRHIPLLGVCRGAQIIAKYFCGDFNQTSTHTKEHLITFLKKQYKVNSYHNYAITSLENFEILAQAEDGSIEAFCSHSHPIFGMLWHMEREKEMSYPSQMMWKKFLEAIEKGF